MKKYKRLNGYILVYEPNHRLAIKSGGEKGYVYEHQVVAEKYLGRPIKKNEEVHHLDFNRANNSRRNLLVVPVRVHRALHAWLHKGAPIGSEKITLSPKALVIAKGSVYTKVKNRCAVCKSVRREGANYCSNKCAQLSCRRTPDVTVRDFKRMFKQNLSWVKIGIELGVSDNGARKIAKRLGFDTKSRSLVE